MTFSQSVKHFFTPHHTNNQRAKLLHPSSLLVIAVFFFVFQIFLRQTSVTFPSVLGYAANIPASEIVRLTNIEREKRNLPPLSFNQQLSSAAAKKAADMFSKNYWAHIAPDGTAPWAFITATGYSYRYAGENLARDFTNSDAVVSAWLASPSHKDNLLSNKYHDIGVAVVDGKFDGRDTTLVVQMFGTQLSVQATKPSVSGGSIQVNLPPVIPQVQAETESIPSSSAPAVVSQFEVSKSLSLILLIGILGTLVFDLVIVYKRSLTRWTSKSLAHLVFVSALVIAVFGILRGRVI